MWAQLCCRFNITRAISSSYYLQTYNNTYHSFTELSPSKVMIGENPVTAANLHIFGSFTPTSTPPMNKLFRHICSRARNHIRLALPPTYEGHNVFHVPQLVPDHPRAGAQLPPEALVGWPPTRDEARKPTDQFLRITYSISRGLETKHVTLLSGKAPPRSGLGGRGCKGPLYVPSKLFRTGQYR